MSQFTNMVKEMHRRHARFPSDILNHDNISDFEKVQERVACIALTHLSIQNTRTNSDDMNKEYRQMLKNFVQIHLCPTKYVEEFKHRELYFFYKYTCMHYLISTDISHDDRSVIFKYEDVSQPTAYYYATMGKLLK